jgi:hypothetical protein
MSALATPIEIDDPRFAAVRHGDFGYTAFIRVSVPPGPEVLWPAIVKRGTRGFFTALDIARPLNCAPQIVETYLAKLTAAGLVGRAGETTERRSLYALIIRKTLPPRVSGRGETDYTYQVTERIWRALRMGKIFSTTSLVAALADPRCPIGRDLVIRYVSELASAGYLDEEGADRPCGEKRWRMRGHMNTGPMPPRMMRAKLVFDPNRQAIAGLTAMAEEVRL